MEKKQSPILQNPYLPGIVLFLIALIIGFLTYKDYGICWDEPYQRAPAILSYNYIMYGNQDLFIKASDNHGAGFEILLVLIEKWMRITDSRDIYFMRHLVSNIFFLIGVFAGYVLLFRLFKNRFIASLGFVMLAFMPRIYAHSFFNTKDVPFLAMIIIALAIAQIAFEKDKSWLFFVLGVSIGYATSIRIMGIMLALFIVLFLIADIIFKRMDKEKPTRQLLHMLLFSLGFCIFLYIPWPFIWKHPVSLFIESFGKMSHYKWIGGVLFDGKLLMSDKP
ncbi:MAG: glycosyltransferase family 39 protein, partial [Flavipsychrobacter sp.]|nr:glycosyltransferase family 39 protein [Flavipsychrobacter sp.]